MGRLWGLLRKKCRRSKHCIAIQYYVFAFFYFTFSDLIFTYDYSESETFFKDNEGNKWNLFGEVIEGPRLGQKMTPAKGVTSMWFAIATFFPNPSIYVE